jgi:hypothetical protein
MSFGFKFKAIDETGKPFSNDIAFHKSLSKDVKQTLINVLRYNEIIDVQIIERLVSELALNNH